MNSKNLSAYSFVSNTVTVKSAVDVKVEDLLDIYAANIDMEETFDFIKARLFLLQAAEVR